MNVDDPLIQSACRIIVGRIGHVIPKLYEERVNLALRRAQATLKAPSLENTLADLERIPIESPAWQQVIESITIGETNFLRHKEWFAEIKNTILAPLIEERSKRGPKRIDLWSAGCSTGEEPYSLAMIVDELLPERRGWSIRILGTDVNQAALAQARVGIYSRWTVREVDAAALAREFLQFEPGYFQLSPRLRSMVDFKIFNLCGDTYPDAVKGFADFDLIICRNVLIYFTAVDQLAVASRLTRSLAPGGWLAVSPAEAAAEWYKPLKVVNRPGAIFFRNVVQAKDQPKVCNPSPAKPKPAAVRRPIPKAPAPTGAMPAGTTAQAAPVASGPVAQETLARARALADRGEYAEARQICEAHLAAAGPDFDAHLILATVCLETGELQAGLEAARCAAYLDPDSAAAHYMLGAIHYRMGARELALRKMAVVVKLLQMQPADAPVSRHFNATAGELLASASGYLGEPLVA